MLIFAIFLPQIKFMAWHTISIVYRLATVIKIVRMTAHDNNSWIRMDHLHLNALLREWCGWFIKVFFFSWATIVTRISNFLCEKIYLEKKIQEASNSGYCACQFKPHLIRTDNTLTREWDYYQICRQHPIVEAYTQTCYTSIESIINYYDYAIYWASKNRNFCVNVCDSMHCQCHFLQNGFLNRNLHTWYLHGMHTIYRKTSN